jgi:hypothetical protein
MLDQEIIKTANWIADNKEEVIRKAEGHLTETIEPFPEDLMTFVEVEEYYSNVSLNVFDVVGTNHPNYVGATWAEMLKLGVRMDSVNLPLLKKNPVYYFERKPKKPAMYYAEIDGKLYIYGDGNHRTSIAKVLFYHTGYEELHGLTLYKFHVNRRKASLVEELKKTARAKGIFLDVELERKRIKREDREGFHRDYYKVAVKVSGRNGKVFSLTDERDLEFLIGEIRNLNWLKKLLGKGRFRELYK